MTQLSKEPYRGTRDFPPKDMFIQTYIFTVWREVCQRFGYEEYTTPLIEPLDIYAAKTSEEIVNQQTYSFEDRGGRKVTIRPELTPSVARLVAAQRQEYGYPLRLFSILNCMRYERPQKGRLREFWQLNADIFGDDSMQAELELIKLMDETMKAFGATSDMYEIRINSRKLLSKRIETAGVKTDTAQAIRVLDNYEKLSKEELTAQLSEHVEDVSALLKSLDQTDNEDYQALLTECKNLGIEAVAYPTLARGFDYYTDIVFEVFDKHPENNRSLFGGGRYDNLVGMFGVEPVPTAGFAMGDATLVEFLNNHKLMPEYLPATELMLAASDSAHAPAVQDIAMQLRELGLNVAVDTSDRKLDKKIKNVIKLGIPFMIFVGEEELKTGEFKLKNIMRNVEVSGDLETLADYIGAFFTDYENE